MAEEETPKSAPAKKAKKPMPEAPPEAPAEPTLPSPHEIREARKAELVKWCENHGLETEGTVDVLRKRLLERIETKEKAAPPLPEKETKEIEKAPPEKKAPAKRAPKGAAKAPEKKAGAKEEEETEEEAEEEYEAKAKPKLDPRLQRLLALRSAKSAARPPFHRQEWFRYKKFGDEWRKPQGGQSKLRRHFGYRWNLPSVGYRGPREVRGLHPSGFQEILVHNERQLDGLDPTKQAVRIAHGVGARKREIIEKACDDKGLRVLNRMVTE